MPRCCPAADMAANILVNPPQISVHRTNAAGVSSGLQFPKDPCSVKTVRFTPPCNNLFLERIDFGMVLGAVVYGGFSHLQQFPHCKFCSNGTLILKSAVHPF